MPKYNTTLFINNALRKALLFHLKPCCKDRPFLVFLVLGEGVVFVPVHSVCLFYLSIFFNPLQRVFLFLFTSGASILWIMIKTGSLGYQLIITCDPRSNQIKKQSIAVRENTMLPRVMLRYGFAYSGPDPSHSEAPRVRSYTRICVKSRYYLFSNSFGIYIPSP